MGRLFGTDGIRGIANTELTCELATSVGKAVATVLKPEKDKKITIVLGCDTRRSSDMLCSAVMAGICSAGGNVKYIGCIPTPAVAFITKHYSADAGIMISASHNPAEYNGIKVFSSEGIKLPDELEDAIEGMITEDAPFPSPKVADLGKISFCADESSSEYSEHLKNSIGIRLDGLSVALDCANGAASRTAEQIFSSLGIDVHTVNASPDGDNINKSCGSTHIETLKEFTKKHNLDAGFAFDGDADRCICVDSDGNEVDGDRILAMCSLDMKKRGLLKNNTVVGTVMTNMGFTQFCRDNGINFIATRVGDRYVLEEMLLGDFSLGGEQSGHIIFRDISKAGDGQLTALQVLSLMKRSGRSLRDLASVMTVYPQTTVNIKADAEAKRSFFTNRNVKNVIKAAAAALSPDGRLLVRPSGTEPLIRIMAEGKDKSIIEETAQNVAIQLNNILYPD